MSGINFTNNLTKSRNERNVQHTLRTLVHIYGGRKNEECVCRMLDGLEKRHEFIKCETFWSKPAVMS